MMQGNNISSDIVGFLGEEILIIVSVIGGGKIGGAVARSIANSHAASKVIVTRRSGAKIENGTAPGLEVTKDNKDAVFQSDLVILAVKASDARAVLNEIRGSVGTRIVLSLMAAISIRKLAENLPGAKIVRAMPNIAATVNESVTPYSLGPGVTPQDVTKLSNILGCFGDHFQVDESLMDAITGLSGSGPAYIAIIVEAMVSAGLKVGIPRETALRLTLRTLLGTAKMLMQRPVHPAELRDAVTTQGGTTIAGIFELEEAKIRTGIMKAVEAATLAASEVAKKLDH